MRIKYGDIRKRGPGYWILNTSILDSPDTEKAIKNLYQFYAPIKKMEHWDFFKKEAANVLREIELERKREKNFEKKQLLYNLTILDQKTQQNEQEKNESILLRQRLKEIDELEWQGARIRSRISQIEDEETPSSYFLKIEKQKKTLIEELKTEQGVVTSNEDILGECTKFYKKLYESEEAENATEIIDAYLKEIEPPTLSLDEKEICESPFTQDSLFKAFSEMAKEKSPGISGLPAEFYQKYFHIFGGDLTELLNKVQDGEEQFSETQRTSLITLIPKGKENLDDLKYWRPIHLLEADRKAATKVKSSHLKKVLHTLIHPDQSAAVPGRSILNSNREMMDIKNMAEKRPWDIAFVSLDQEKAFDRLEHSFIKRYFAHSGFGPKFRNFIDALLRNIIKLVYVNGYAGEPFQATRSVLQGDSIAMEIFTATQEIFAIAIRKNPKIKPILIPGVGEKKITGFADDNTIIVSAPLPPAIKEIKETFEKYAKISGAKLNTEKCEILQISPKIRYKVIEGIKVKNEITLLGTKYSENADNWSPRIEKYLNIINFHKPRKLTMRGRAVILNTKAITQLLYTGENELPPKKEIKKLERANFDFIFNSKSQPIARETLYRNWGEGGIGLVDINRKFETMRTMSMVKMVLDTQNDEPKLTTKLALKWIGFSLNRIYPTNKHRINYDAKNERPEFHKEVVGTSKTITDELKGRGNPEKLEILKNMNSKKIYQKLNSKRELPRVVSKHVSADYKKQWSNCADRFFEPEIRDFIFRASHEVLPTADHIHRGIVRKLGRGRSSPNCKLCHQEIETRQHILIKCKIGKEMWD